MQSAGQRVRNCCDNIYFSFQNTSVPLSVDFESIFAFTFKYSLRHLGYRTDLVKRFIWFSDRIRLVSNFNSPREYLEWIFDSLCQLFAVRSIKNALHIVVHSHTHTHYHLRTEKAQQKPVAVLFLAHQTAFDKIIIQTTAFKNESNRLVKLELANKEIANKYFNSIQNWLTQVSRQEGTCTNE